MATNSKSNELIFRSRFFRIHKNKSPALGGMSFFIVFCTTAAASAPPRPKRTTAATSAPPRPKRTLRVRLFVVGLDIVAPLCLMMMIAAVAARMHPSTCPWCSGGDASSWLERLVPRLQPVVVAAAVHVFYARFVVGLSPPAP